MFKVSPASFQIFIDTPDCVLANCLQYSTVHIPNVFCDGHLQLIIFVGIVWIQWVFHRTSGKTFGRRKFRQGQGDTRLTLSPSVIPNSNYIIMVGDWNCLKYCIFACFLYCKLQVHRDVLITLYIQSIISNPIPWYFPPTKKTNCYGAVGEYIRVIGQIIFMIPVLFFRDSMLLSGLSVVIAITLRGLTSTSAAPPHWVNGIIRWILSFRPGQLLLLTNPLAEVIICNIIKKISTI